MINRVIKENNINYTPVWFMRQSGRHLKDYIHLRNKHKTFIEFCLNEKSVEEATLLPLKHYKLDALILFSDILLVPWVLGQKVEFIKNFGPKLRPLDLNDKILTSDFDLMKLNSISNAIKKIKVKSPKSLDLIGFSGAPWTLACYMIEGGGSKNFEKIRKILWANDKWVYKLIKKLTSSVCDFLEFQAKSGADVLMIFDTWSHMIPYDFWKDFAITPVKEIIIELRKRKIFCPVIGFPFKAGEKLIEYSYESEVDVISIDWNTSLKWVLNNINKSLAIQGNLDPLLLTTEREKKIEDRVNHIMNIMQKRVHIFNVGHGFTPDCKKSSVKKAIEIVRNFNK